jgi:hypothetical protein
MDATRYARLESLELACQTQQGDAWKLAWDVVDLAAEIHAEAGKTPPADALAATWYCLVFAKSCDRRLAAEGRTSADDSGDTASTRVQAYLDRLAGRAMDAAMAPA